MLLLSSCKSTKESSSEDVQNSLQGSFSVEKINDENVSELGLTFIIDPINKSVSGNSGCNTYSGNYELSEANLINFNKVFTSKKYCVEKEKNEIEKKYIGILSNSFNIKLQKEKIELISNSNETIRILLTKE